MTEAPILLDLNTMLITVVMKPANVKATESTPNPRTISEIQEQLDEFVTQASTTFLLV